MIGKEFAGELKRGVKSATNARRTLAATSAVSIIAFILIALSTSIRYTFQMFSYGPEYWITAVVFTIRGVYLTGGVTGLTINLAYSFLIGVLVTNTYYQFKNSGLKLGKISGVAPGFLIAGCAGCGVGILSLIGLTGILAFLPYQGTSIKILGIIVLCYFIAETGKPEICSIPSS